VEKSRYETIDDSAEEFINFAAILEQILNHRIKQRTTWYGSSQETKTFWDFARLACKRVANNCLANVEAMEELKTGRGKGRAWVRMALMEKKLSEYIVSALQQTKIIKTFYEEGAIMLSEESHILAGILLGLNSIDFSFCLKGENLEIDIPAVIDYTPYLKYPNSTPDTSSLDGGERDFNDSAELISSIISGTESAIGGDVNHDVLNQGDVNQVTEGGDCADSEVRRNFSSVSLGSLEDTNDSSAFDIDINGNNNNGGTGDSGVGGAVESYFLGSDSPPSQSNKSMDSISLSTVDTNHENNNENSNSSEESIRAKYKKLEAKYKTVCEQKGYLEELVRLRESQLEDAHKQRQKLVDTIQNFEGESRKERQQLEGIIIELQAQLSGSPLPSRDVDELCWDALTPAQVFGSEDDLTTSSGLRGFLESELKLEGGKSSTNLPSSSTPMSKAERKKLLPENNWLKTLYNEISSGEKQDNEESEKARLLRRVGDAAKDAAASTATPQQQQILLHQQTQNRLMREGCDDEDRLLDGEAGLDEDGEQKKVVPEEAEETFRKLRKANDKAIRYSLHRETLMKYLDKDLVPRGLRINLVPTIGNQVEDFVTKWRDTLHNASKGLMELIVEFCTKEEAKLNVEIMKLQAKLYDMINDTHQLAETSNLIANLSERARERLTRRKERKLERDEGDMMTVRDNRTGEVIATLKSHNPLLDPPLPASTHQKNYAGGGAELFYGEPLSAAGFYHPHHLPYPALPYITPPPSVKDDSSVSGGGGVVAGEGDGDHPKPVDAVVVEKSKMNPNAKPFEVPLFHQQQPQQLPQPSIPAPASSTSTSSATSVTSSSSYMMISQDFATPVMGGVYVNTNYASNTDLASSYATVGSALPYGTTPVLPVGGGPNYGGGGGRDSGGGRDGGVRDSGGRDGGVGNRGGRQYRGAGSGRLHGGRGGGSSHMNGNANRDATQGGRDGGGGGRWETGGRGGRGGSSAAGGDHYRGGGRGGGRGVEPGTPSSRHRSSQHNNVNNGLGVLPNGYSSHYSKKHGAAH